MILERDTALGELNRANAGVTVCLTTHNDAHVLQRAFVSVLEQTVAPFEVIIVDDGSDLVVNVPSKPDNYPHIPVRVVRITNRGLPSARNTALMLCRSIGFLCLDADDWIEPTFIEKTLPLLVDADVVLTGLQEHGPTRNGCYMAGYDRPYDQVTLDVIWADGTGYNRFFYAALIRTQLLREVGGYHPAMAGWPGVAGGYEDWDLWVTLMNRDTRFVAVDEALLHYSTENEESMLHRAERNRDVLIAEMRRHHRM